MTSFWQFFAGLGIFLYGMFLLEKSLKELAGRTFKIFLKKHTGNKLKALLSGTLITALLQSSSVVSFMVLAFVGAGILSMRNALAVIFGSNIGTTLDSWVVAILGFKFNIESFSFPIIALAGFIMLFPIENRKLRNISYFGIGFGLLFMGIGYMKESIESFVKAFDLRPYYDYNRVVFVALGCVGTFLIQSSSAMVVIVLSALSQNAIPFNAAVAIIIGAELGSSFKLSLGSIKGIAEKKRAALGNMIFNSTMVILATALMDPLIWLVKLITGDDNPLIAFVLFQTIINVQAVLLFMPFLNKFADFLSKRYSGTENRPVFFISDSKIPAAELSVDLMEKEVLYFLHRVIVLNLDSFHVKAEDLSDEHKIINDIRDKIKADRSFADRYKSLKSAEGEILTYYFGLDKEELNEVQLKRLEALLSTVRNSMYSAKCMKDVHEDFKEFKKSSQDSKFHYQQELSKWLLHFYKDLLDLLGEKERAAHTRKSEELLKRVKKDYAHRMDVGHKIAEEGKIESKDIPTLLNVNREMYSSCESIIFATRNFTLENGENGNHNAGNE